MLTTGEIAKYCGVSYHTVIRWVKRGELEAFQLPGRGDRRIKEADFLKFMEKKGFPIPEKFRGGQKRILIVDDDVAIAEVMDKAIQAAGYETALAHNGFQAGALSEQFKPNVITLDLDMPGLDGFGLLKMKKEAKDGAALSRSKICVVSACTAETLQSSLLAGADDILAKPFEHDHLIEKIQRLAGLPEAERVR